MKGRGAPSYRLSPRAFLDLEEIWDFGVRTWSPAQAAHYHSSLVKAFDALASGRKTGRKVDIRAGYFKHAVGTHLVFYRHARGDIVVIRVLHQRMDVDRHL
ncbi:MAG: type II toxin-antitoxin system RelE/ParE family toxin [Alphaproteobacteria bacterium]|nr:type II toxin-antitoxin system RelE/ParE family toxin [Alphaproteobacteria bacterium]